MTSAPCRFISIRAGGDLEQVIAELGLHRALHFVDSGREYHLVEFRDHLAGSERTKIAARGARWAGGMSARQIAKIFAAGYLSLELFALCLGINQNVSCGGLSHGSVPL